jgi:hypothetical protein
LAQEILVGSDPMRFFKPFYIGHKGWVGVRLDVKVGWDELAAIVKDGLEPKRLGPRPWPRTPSRGIGLIQTARL